MNELDGPLLAEDNNKKQTEPKEDTNLKENKDFAHINTLSSINSSESINSNSSNSSTMKQKKVGDEVMFAITFIARIIMTLYSFHGLFFIYNFIIQYIILVPGILYEIDNLFSQIFLGCIYIIFAMCTSNVLVIPTYEFLLFPYLNFRNPLYHLQSLQRTRYIINDRKDKLIQSEEELENERNIVVNVILIIIEVFYGIGYILGLASITIKMKDYVKIVILFLIYTYYLVIFLGYIFLSIYLCLQFFIFSYQNNSGCWTIIKKTFDLNAFFGDPDKNKDKPNQRDIGPLPRINLFSYIIHPLLKKSYKNRENLEISQEIDKAHCEDYFYYFKIISRFLLFIFSFVLICFIINRKDITSIIFFIIFFLLMLFVSTVMNFPVCFRNKKTFGHFWSGKIKYKKEYKMKHPYMITFVRFLCNILITLAALLLFVSFFYFKESNELTDLSKLSLKSSKQTINTNDLLLPNICFSSIHKIDIYLYLPFINDAYYYNDKPEVAPYYYSSFHIPGYKSLFFDNSYEIDVVGNLINNTKRDESVKMIQYNVKNSKEEVTILAIKGTSNKKDVYIDFQLYFPSILLSILSTFSIMGKQKETLSFRFIEFSLSIPYRIFFQYSVIEDYLTDLTEAYNKNYKTFYKHIVIVGHSLGGGLAKLFGRIIDKQAISLSGPGVNAFHSLWGYEGKSENFEISAIDLVPDMDLVPRVEVSGGTIYRIICKSGPFGCHSKALSLCEVLIMCRNPNYETYCKQFAQISDNAIKELYESSELN